MLPNCVKYNSIKPKGFATKNKRWCLNPQSSYNSFNKNELVRFVIDSDGFVDPYKIYVDVVVSTTQALQVNPGVIMLDGPSTSIFQTLTIYSNSKQIERVDEYDQLGNILRDVQYEPLIEANRQYEGFAYNEIANNNNIMVESPCSYDNHGTWNNALANYTRNSARWRPNSPMPLMLNSSDFIIGAPGTLGNQMANRNMYMSDSANYLINDRFDLRFQEADTEFGVDVYDTNTQGAYDVSDNKKASGISGYLYPYSQSLARGKSAYMCPMGQKLKVVNGKFLHSTDDGILGGFYYDEPTNPVINKYQTTKIRLLVPILSGVLGILIPRDQWKLLPLAAFKQLMFEFRLNPYAFFSAGYASSVIPTSQIKAEWKVESIQMVFDLWYFDEQITNQINQALNGEGIILSSQSASMGPMYNIIANGTVTNNWQINNGIESCKAIYFWFLDNRYQIYPHCRKNFRLSQNIKSVQLKVGPDWVPPYPIQGNAGNIGLNNDISSADGDNTEFLVELQKSFNKLFDCNDNISIDKLNFAINERSYNPIGTSACYGCALWEEMRCQGRALYAISLDQNPYDSDVLSGLDTTKVRPIELVIKGTDQNKFAFDSTLYVLLWHDFYVQINNNGVTTFGQG